MNNWFISEVFFELKKPYKKQHTTVYQVQLLGYSKKCVMQDIYQAIIQFSYHADAYFPRKLKKLCLSKDPTQQIDHKNVRIHVFIKELVNINMIDADMFRKKNALNMEPTIHTNSMMDLSSIAKINFFR